MTITVTITPVTPGLKPTPLPGGTSGTTTLDVASQAIDALLKDPRAKHGFRIDHAQPDKIVLFCAFPLDSFAGVPWPVSGEAWSCCLTPGDGTGMKELVAFLIKRFANSTDLAVPVLDAKLGERLTYGLRNMDG